MVYDETCNVRAKAYLISSIYIIYMVYDEICHVRASLMIFHYRDFWQNVNVSCGTKSNLEKHKEILLIMAKLFL